MIIIITIFTKIINTLIKAIKRGEEKEKKKKKAINK